MEGPIINRKMVRNSEQLKRIQKEAKARYRGRSEYRNRQIKARISKVVRLREANQVVDLTSDRQDNQTYENLYDAAKQCNIFGMSGSGFPAVKKLESVRQSKAKIKYCIINAVECEPGLLQDEWLVNHRFAEICDGVRALFEFLPFQKIVLASKLVLKEAQSAIPNFSIVKVPNKYPMGEEHILVQQVLGIELGKEQCPADCGILVLNVQTLIAITEAMQGMYPEQSKYITVADLRNGQAAIARVTIGMRASDIIGQIFPGSKNGILYVGGGVMFAEKASYDTLVDEHTGMIAYGEKIPFAADAKCKKCGKCSSRCPMGVKVHKLIATYEKNPKGDWSEFGIENCIQCGTCSYVCGAERDNMEFIQNRRKETGWKQ